MAKRRTKRPAKRSAKKPLNKLTNRLKARRNAVLAAAKRAPAFRLPHSSVFAAGIAIGLALGVILGVGIVWLDGRGHKAAGKTSIVDTMTAPAPKIATAQTAPVAPSAPAMPPAYVEETEPGIDEAPAPMVAAPEATAAPANPPAVVDATPQPAPAPAITPAVPPIAPIQPGIPAPETQAAAPAPQVAAPQVAGLTPPPPPIVQQAWMKNAVASVETDGRPMIAIVLDDVGAAPTDVPGALALPSSITLSIMTYAPNADRIAKAAHADGHEILVHVPMEPISRSADPGPNALLTSLPSDEIKRRMQWDLSQFSGYVGINNHMGSKFTQDTAGMRTVLDFLKERGLIYFDSRTIAASVGDKLAGQMGVTHVVRDVFLDDVIEVDGINKQLARAETIARKRGYVVAIGHPHPDTVSVLRQWIPQAEAAGFVLVPLSQIVKRNAGVTG